MYRIFIYIPSALFIFDRLVRTSLYIYHNVRPGRATLTSYDNVTKICIRTSRVKHWKPGQFVLLCIPRIGLGQSHPATIASIPSSHNGDLVFFLRSHKGWTEKILRRASPSKHGKPESTGGGDTFVALTDGPYGGTHSDFAAFDTTLLVAGSTGVTFTLPILLDIAQRATTQKLPLRDVTFVWAVKHARAVEWIKDELHGAVEKLNGVGIATRVLIFVTCDDTLTEGQHRSEKCTCNSTPCRCLQTVQVSNADDPDRIEESSPASQEPNSMQLGFGALRSGRPDLKSLIWKLLGGANGETGVGVCGPLGLAMEVRNIVAAASDARGVHKGTGAEGIYLHVECFTF
jgi:ferric-chelate reductase